jgi:site-specific recombinase XerC
MNATTLSLSTATDEFLRSAADGLTRDPSGVRYSSQALEELRIALRGHVAEELGDIPLGALRRWQVQAFVNELAGSGLAPRRLRAILAALRALTRYARQEGLLDEDPTQGVIVPTEDGHEPRTFTTTDQLATVQPPGAPGPMIPDAALWQLMKVVTIVFVLIAIVLAAESI